MKPSKEAVKCAEFLLRIFVSPAIPDVDAYFADRPEAREKFRAEMSRVIERCEEMLKTDLNVKLARKILRPCHAHPGCYRLLPLGIILRWQDRSDLIDQALVLQMLTPSERRKALELRAKVKAERQDQ